MAVIFNMSTAARDYVAGHGSVRRAMHNGVWDLYTGSPPANADLAATGTWLGRLTLGKAAFTSEVLARGSITLAGASGTVTQIKLNDLAATTRLLVNLMDYAVPFNGTLSQTVTNVIDCINSSRGSGLVKAIDGGSNKIIIELLPGTIMLGDFWNAKIAYTLTTLTATTCDVGYVAGGGTAGSVPVNGLMFGPSVDGVLTPIGVWQGDGVATDVAGYARARGSVAEAHADSDDSSTKKYIRFDMNIGTVNDGSTALYMPSADITSGAPVTLNDNGSSFTMPV